MKIILLTLLFNLMAWTWSDVMAQQTVKTTPTSVIGYLEYLPQDYASNSNKYPIVIFLHGLGERGPNTTVISEIEAGISIVTRNGPPNLVKNGTQFPFILISPQLKNNFGDWQTWYVMEVINYVKTYLRVDEKRIYITGLSLGGGGTWWVSQDNPKLFAAAAPVCGSRNTLSKACLLAAENLPVWAFHGDADGTVPMARSVNMVNAINACTPTPSPKAQITIYTGVGHNSWDRAYSNNHDYQNPSVYEWMLAQTNTINAGNKIPTAQAGADVVKSLPITSLTLKGSATDTDGTIASYQWTKISGPAATLTAANTATLTLSGLSIGDYIFRLTVTDDKGDTDSDYVKVSVSSNLTPVANAGSDVTVTLPTTTAAITGAATDADGTVTAYAWTKVSGGTATLTNANTSKLALSALAEGSYVFRLTVTDNQGGTGSDDVNLTVVKTAVKNPPTVDAGVDRVIKLPGTSAWLTGTVISSDVAITQYKWTQVSGPAVKISSETDIKAKLSQFTLSGVCVFRLTVTDANGSVASDDVQITFSFPPTADAGADASLTLPTNTIVLKGKGSDVDGTITSYRWRQDSGPSTATMSSKTTASITLSNLVQGEYIFRLAVLDNASLEGSDYVTITVLAASGTAARTQTATSEGTRTSTAMKTAATGDLAQPTQEYWNDKHVIIFNEQSARIHDGTWTEAGYQQVVQHPGLYVYHVLEQGARIGGGKLYITR